MRRLLIATGASSIGDGVRFVVMPLMAMQLTSDPRLITGVFVADRLPWLLLLLPGGALADRFDRLRMRVLMDAARAVLAAGFVILAATGHAGLATVYLVTVLMASADALVDSSSMALVPSLVDRDDLERAAGSMQATELVTRDVVGPALGGVLFTVGLIVPLAVDAVSFAASAAVAVTIRGSFRVPRAEPSDVGVVAAARDMRRSIAAGLAWLWHQPTLRALACLSTVLGVVSGAFISVFVIYATDDLGLGPTGFGLLMIPSAVGGLVGAWLAPRLRRLPLATAVGGGVVVSGAAELLIASTSTVALVVVLLVVDTAGVLVWNVLTIAFRQRTIPDEMLGRVGSGYRFMLSLGVPLGAFVGGTLAASVGARVTLGVAGAATCVAGVAAIVVLGARGSRAAVLEPTTVPA